ncbi:putative peroxiredoxin [Methylohalomonas lacus]|uniref:Peroxiredoxin n=1 Tax=Methylohalomonas lacus TaxID=398773 RepID=A0AAE3HHX7_9GAMM|nr:DsrE family protein [Methylohalomonas lacus]MCS3902661.1 putative peroxiredoxin [Methylohalomonas lacus]
MKFQSLRYYSLIALTCLAMLFTTNSQAESESLGQDQNVVVHLSNYTNDLHASFMALKLAVEFQQHGANVTLFLDLEGVRIADKRAPQDMNWGLSHAPLSEHYTAFIEAGGEVLVCPHCAAAAGIDADNLRKGARIANEDDDEITRVFLGADKILKY